jgi:hypothetical protein
MVKCCNCGRLAVIDEYSKESREATEMVTTSGWHASSAGNATIARVNCHAGKRDFADLRGAPAGAVLTEINAEIGDCSSFIKRIAGRSPKEHEDMSILDRVRAEQTQFQLDIREEERRTHEENRRDNERRHQESRKDQETYNQQIAVRTRINLLLTALSVACAIFTVWMSYRPAPIADKPAIQKPGGSVQQGRDTPSSDIKLPIE